MSVDKYDETISESKQESLIKALTIFNEEESKNKKEVSRPNINLTISIANIFGITIGFLLIPFLSIIVFNAHKNLLIWIFCFVFEVTFVIFTSKKFIITLILIYQKVAPERIRSACLFEPSCSNYMLLAIKKYGLIKGVFKGIKRLLKCHQPNGGFDNP